MRIDCRRIQRGMTLVEVMVSIAVGLILLAGILSIFVGNKEAYRLQESTNVLNENARYALNQLQYDLRMGEHWGGIQPDDVTVDAPLQALAIATACSESPVISGMGFTGIEGAATTPLDCIPNADYEPNTDILIVRYAEPARCYTNADPPLYPCGVKTSADIFVRASIGRRATVFQGTAVAGLTTDLLPADIDGEPEDELNDEPQMAYYPYRVAIYFIRRCASQDRGTAGVCDAADDSIPTLARLVLDGPALVQEDVVAGIEQFQLSFGLLDPGTEPPQLEYQDAATIEANDDWGRVANVLISMVVRGEGYDAAYTDNRSFTMHGGYTYTPVAADRSYHRKLYNFAVQIRNITRG